MNVQLQKHNASQHEMSRQ